jgi:NTE family protein
MIGLALQGGGARGAYQAGACIAFKKYGIKFKCVCGTSIGAFNGAMVASGKEKELLEFWQNIDMGKILGFDHEYVEKIVNKERDLKAIKLKFKNFLNILSSRGINIKGLEDVLKEYLNEETLRNSSIEYGICTVRLNDLTPLYIYKEDMIKGKLYDYILASCYLPLFKMEKKVDDKYYLDGGFYDNTPVNMLIKKGFKKIYVVELNPIINISRKPLEDVEIIKITPKRSVGQVVNFDLENIREIIKMGYYDTLRVIKKLDGINYCFTKHSNYFYQIITRKIPLHEIEKIKGFFRVKTTKEAVIQSLEYIMKNEGLDYYQIYKPTKIIKKVKKETKKEHFVYDFVRKIQVL